jgi:hypothetical protein
MALLPKCPICLSAYFCAFSSIGLATSVGFKWVTALVVVALVACVAATGLGKGARRKRGPFAARAIAVVAILLGRFGPSNPTLLVTGLALLIVAWLLDHWPSKVVAPDASLAIESMTEVPR